MAKKVKIKVDMENREKLRRLHTATHIMNFSAREVLGNHVWQNGSTLKPEFGTLDITHYDNLSQDEIFQIERMANKTVFENKKVTIEELDRTKAEKKYGFSLYQGGIIPMKKLRIIKITDSDIEACGGIHMESTGGIGLIKIIQTQKIQDGIIRLKYVVNEFALQEVENIQNILNQTSKTLSVTPSQIPKTAKKFFDDWKTEKKENEKLKEKLKTTYTDIIKLSKGTQFKFDYDIDINSLTEIFNNSGKKELMIDTQKFIIASNHIKIKKFKKELPKGDFKIYIK